MVLNHIDVVFVDDEDARLTNDVHNVDVLDDDIVVDLIPFDKMVHEGTDVYDVGEDVSPLDVMRPAGFISWWTRMCDVQCFPLMQCNKYDVEAVVDDGLNEDEIFANEDTENGQVDARGLDILLIDPDVLHIDDVLL